MNVSSAINTSFYNNNQTNTAPKNSEQEYLHKAIAFNGSDKTVEFTDIDTNKKVEIALGTSLQKELEKKFNTKFDANTSVIRLEGDLEEYFQHMWFYLKYDTNTKDNNSDGYLDIDELVDSKRVVTLNFDEASGKASIEENSFREAYASDAIHQVNAYLAQHGITDGRISMDLDFNLFVLRDQDLNGSFNDNEILHSLKQEIKTDNLSGKSLRDIFLEMIKAWAEEQKKKGLNGIAEGAFISDSDIKEKAINKLLSNEADMSKLSKEEKSVFLQNRKSTQNSETFSMEQLVQIKERLTVSSKYSNTQVNSAQIFSLKI
jgi:hypothetical protein